MIFNNSVTGQSIEISNQIDINNLTALDNASQKLAEQIKALMPGQTIEGIIVAREGTNIQLEVNQEFYMQAQMGEDVPLEFGKSLTFQVQNDGNKITLTPLFANLATKETAMQALSMANLPATDQNLQLVKHMMEASLSIQKDHILNLVKELNINPNLDPKTLVQLHKLDIPITEANVAQANQYQNATHQIEMGLNQIFGEIDQTLLQLLQQGNISDKQGGIGQFLQQLSTTVTEPFTLNLVEMAEQLQATSGKEEIVNNVEDTSSGNDFLGKLQATLKGDVFASQELSNPVHSIVNVEGGQFIAEKINEFLKLLQATDSHIIANASEFGSDLHKVSQEILYALKLGFKDQFSIQPEQLKEDKSVTQLYDRLQTSLSQISEAASQLLGKENAISQSSTNLSQNIDFMNHLNQVFQFAQLPLKLQGNQAHGDLYVYTNKRNLAQNEGKVSAFLHLDMDHLGAVDIHVTLEEKNVSTDFQVQNEEILDLIGKHIERLNHRLEEKGYQVTVKAKVREDGTMEQDENSSVLDRILKETPTAQFLSSRSFDVRA